MSLSARMAHFVFARETSIGTYICTVQAAARRCKTHHLPAALQRKPSTGEAIEIGVHCSIYCVTVNFRHRVCNFHMFNFSHVRIIYIPRTIMLHSIIFV